VRQNHRRKYRINENFFNQWSPVMAYVLGFWFADGYMRIDKSYRIAFFSADIDILEQIRGVLESSHPIRPHQDNCWHIILHSKKMYADLTSLGGKKRKSRTIKFPYTPSKLLRDFIRGYFDGDGSVFFVNYIRTKDHRNTKELRTNFTSGSKMFLEQLNLILNKKLDLSLKKLGIYNNGSSLKLGFGMKDSETLLRYMYYDNFPIGMKRKADFIAKIPEYQKHFFK